MNEWFYIPAVAMSLSGVDRDPLPFLHLLGASYGCLNTKISSFEIHWYYNTHIY